MVRNQNPGGLFLASLGPFGSLRLRRSDFSHTLSNKGVRHWVQGRVHLGLVDIDERCVHPRLLGVNIGKLLPFKQVLIVFLAKGRRLQARDPLRHNLDLLLDHFLFLIGHLMALPLLQKLVSILIAKIQLDVYILGPNSSIPLALIKVHACAEGDIERLDLALVLSVGVHVLEGHLWRLVETARGVQRRHQHLVHRLVPQVLPLWLRLRLETKFEVLRFV
jgi:hypothetical protein